MPINEFLDRLSIVILKQHCVPEEVQEEFDIFYMEFSRLCVEYPEWDLPKWLQALLEVNQEIWNLESDLRRGQLQQYDVEGLKGLADEELLQLASMGRAAVAIRNVNKKRKSLQAALVEITETGWKDIKVNCVSQEEPSLL